LAVQEKEKALSLINGEYLNSSFIYENLIDPFNEDVDDDDKLIIYNHIGRPLHKGKDVVYNQDYIDLIKYNKRNGDKYATGYPYISALIKANLSKKLLSNMDFLDDELILRELSEKN